MLSRSARRGAAQLSGKEPDWWLRWGNSAGRRWLGRVVCLAVTAGGLYRVEYRNMRTVFYDPKNIKMPHIPHRYKGTTVEYTLNIIAKIGETAP
jgi:hypothetical protein